MDIVEYLRYIPEIIAWAVGIVLGAIMVKQGDRLEKLLLTGCILMFTFSLASPFIHFINIAIGRGWVKWVELPAGFLGIAGLVCLVWAFWVKFKPKKQAAYN